MLFLGSLHGGMGFTNPLEPYLESAWNYMTDNYSLFMIAVFGSYLAHLIFEVISTAPGFIAQFLPSMQKYKIQPQVQETFEDQWKVAKHTVFIHLVYQFPGKIGLYFYMIWTGAKYDYNSIPSWYVLLAEIYVAFIIEDTWHYFAHRLLHHPKLYKHVHKFHHTIQAPFANVLEYSSPIEMAFVGIGSFLPIIFFMDHLAIIWLWTGLRIAETAEVHSGYDIPFISPFKLMPGYAGPRFHDFHHQNFVGNYAPTFVWWDKLLGTDNHYHNFIKGKKTD